MTNPRKTVLVVEDDPAVRKLMQRHLATLDVEVVEVGDARSAHSKLAEGTPDLVCLDLMLPDQSGLSLCEEMRRTAALKDVPILVVTARNSVADRAQAEELGITSYLTKPFSRLDFLRMARQLLERPA